MKCVVFKLGENRKEGKEEAREGEEGRARILF